MSGPIDVSNCCYHMIKFHRKRFIRVIRKSLVAIVSTKRLVAYSNLLEYMVIQHASQKREHD
jgi:hypothetical protein